MDFFFFAYMHEENLFTLTSQANNRNVIILQIYIIAPVVTEKLWEFQVMERNDIQ